MTTKIDDNQIAEELYSPSDYPVKSITSTTITVTDDGQGNITLSAPTVVTPPPAVLFTQSLWTSTRGSWVNTFTYSWPATSGTVLVETIAENLPGTGGNVIRFSGEYIDTTVQDLQMSVVTSNGATFVGAPTYVNGVVSETGPKDVWYIDIDLTNDTDIEALSWTSLGGWVPFTINSLVIL